MLYTYGTTAEVYATAERFPDPVFTELLTGCVVLDSDYGEDRDYYSSGGYSLVAETADDLAAMKELLDYDSFICEWVTRIRDSGYISALYILDNDFCVMLFMPESIAPQVLLSELED